MDATRTSNPVKSLEPHRTGDRIPLTARDGFDLGARLFVPASTPRATVLIHSATGAPQRYYSRFAAWMASQGFRVMTYDYRGIGTSRPRSLRGFRASMTDWATLDATAATDVASQFGREPLVVIGHSFGGQLLGLVDDYRRADAVVMVGAQFGYWGFWEQATERLRLRTLWNAIVPTANALFGYLPGSLGLGIDLPAGVASEWARWCSHPDYLLIDHPTAAQRFQAIDKPFLFYSFTDDEFAPRRAVDRYLATLPPDAVLHRRLRPSQVGTRKVGHFGFFRAQFEKSLWRETLGFVSDVLDRRTPAIASRLESSVQNGGLTEEDIMHDLHWASS